MVPFRHEHAIALEIRFLDLLLHVIPPLVGGLAVVQPQRANIVRHAETVDRNALSPFAVVGPVQIDDVRHLVRPRLAPTLNAKKRALPLVLINRLADRL